MGAIKTNTRPNLKRNICHSFQILTYAIVSIAFDSCYKVPTCNLLFLELCVKSSIMLEWWNRENAFNVIHKNFAIRIIIRLFRSSFYFLFDSCDSDGVNICCRYIQYPFEKWQDAIYKPLYLDQSFNTISYQLSRCRWR